MCGLCSEPVVEVVLYTRAGCHLCEEVRRELAALVSVYPHRLREVDITADPKLHRRYHLTIPVVAGAGREVTAPITAGQLRRFLQEIVAPERD